MTAPKTWYFTPTLWPSSSYDVSAREYTALAAKMGLALEVRCALSSPELFKAQYHNEADLALFRLQVGV